MTDHQRFKALINKLGLSYLDIANHLGMQYNSVKSQLAPSKNLPKWAKTMLLMQERLCQ